MKFCGMMNTVNTNGITYNDFRNGYFFAVYDLRFDSFIINTLFSNSEFIIFV